MQILGKRQESKPQLRVYIVVIVTLMISNQVTSIDINDYIPFCLVSSTSMEILENNYRKGLNNHQAALKSQQNNEN